MRLLELADERLIERYSDVISVEESVVGRVWNFRDVTQRHESDLIPRRLAAIVESSDDAIIGKDLNSIVLPARLRSATRCSSRKRLTQLPSKVALLI